MDFCCDESTPPTQVCYLQLKRKAIKEIRKGKVNKRAKVCQQRRKKLSSFPLEWDDNTFNMLIFTIVSTVCTALSDKNDDDIQQS